MFPAGRKLPHLHTLIAHGDFYLTVSIDEKRQSQAMAADGMSRLCICCPALQHLDVCPAEGASPKQLRALTALTKLSAHRVKPAGICSLTALTRLQALVLTCRDVPGAVRDVTHFQLHHLAPLVALTGLTVLRARVKKRLGTWGVGWGNKVSMTVTG